MSQRRIFVSVAEVSADVHAASLVRAARSLLPDCHFYGLTGPRMRDAGVESLGDLTAHAAMLAGAARSAHRAVAVRGVVEASWRRQPPDLVVLLDSSVFHLPLAAAAKKLRRRVLYYIAPQTWASRPYRNRQLARLVDHVACILPFEQEHFARHGVRATFVGHPLFEALRDEHPDAARVATLRGSPPSGATLVALLPGARTHVIDEVLPIQLDIVRRLRAEGRPVQAAISCHSPQSRAQIERHVDYAGIPAELVVDDNASLLTAADLVLVASGTATLHVAHYLKPMVVLYNVKLPLGPLYRRFGRLVVSTPHLSLLNILAAARIVPEFMPFVPDVDTVTRLVGRLIDDTAWRNFIVSSIERTIAPLETSNASANVCRLIAESLAMA
ncbi:MAG: Lipid-A-disaccharide synthase [Phycisphaerae bacterium]|nr:Lipid-A-disaccharide synthase [Phycisphaerae bacterium]